MYSNSIQIALFFLLVANMLTSRAFAEVPVKITDKTDNTEIFEVPEDAVAMIPVLRDMIADLGGITVYKDLSKKDPNLIIPLSNDFIDSYSLKEIIKFLSTTQAGKKRFREDKSARVSFAETYFNIFEGGFDFDKATSDNILSLLKAADYLGMKYVIGPIGHMWLVYKVNNHPEIFAGVLALNSDLQKKLMPEAWHFWSHMQKVSHRLKEEEKQALYKMALKNYYGVQPQPGTTAKEQFENLFGHKF